MGAYSNLLAQSAQVAQTPYQSYGNELVAPVNQQQNLGIGNINQYAQSAQPAINQALGYANQAAQPVTAAQIQQYQSPYTQQVVNATQAQFANQNAQQQSALQGNAISQGALGGDRAGVAAANLAGQQSLAQAPVIAGLYNQGYQNAEQMALAEQANKGNQAYAIGNLGAAGQNAALTGAGAQIGAGTLQQQTQQAQDLAAYQQFLQKQAYPFQTLSWESGIDTGVGSQMGGTSQTTTQAPPPNPVAQYGGLALMGLGMFSDERMKEGISNVGKTHDGQPIYRYRYKGDPTWHMGLIAQDVEKTHPEAVGEVAGAKTVDVHEATKDAVRASGGLVGYDTGGTPYGGGVGWNPNGAPYAGAIGYVPTNQITMGQGAPHGSSGSSGSGATDTTGGIKGLADAYKLGKGFDFNKTGFGSAIGDMLSGGTDNTIGGNLEAIDYAEGGDVPPRDYIYDPSDPNIQRRIPYGGGVRGKYALGSDVEDTPDLSPAAYTSPDPNAEWNAFRQDVQSDPTSSVNAQPGVASTAPTGVAPPLPAPATVAPTGRGAQYAGLFRAKEEQYGLPQGYLNKTAGIESTYNANAKPNQAGAAGLFQFIPRTANEYGLKNRYDPEASTDAAARYAVSNKNYLRNYLGRDPTAGELYLAHQQGPNGALRLITNPNAPAGSVVSPQAIAQNGGDPRAPASQFVGMWTNKFGGTGPARGGSEADDFPDWAPSERPSGGQQTAQNQPQGLASDQGFLGKGGLFNMEGATRQGLVAAGLGMLASRSPYAGVGIGEGGLQGLKTYEAAKNKDTDIDLAHTKLTQAAKFHQDQLEQESKKLQQANDIAEENRKERNLEHQKPFPVGSIPNPNGLSPPTPILGIPNPAWKEGTDIPKYLGTDGKPIDPALLNPSLRAAPPQVPGTPPAGQPQNTPANPPVPPTAPAQPGAPVAGQQPYQVASADGIIPANSKLAEGPYDYSRDGPYLEKGMDVPEPQPVSGRSSGDIKTQGEYYLQTGKLPPVSRGNSPVAVQQELLRRSVENYGTALAQSRGLSPQETAEMWRSAPGMLRFVLGPDGRSTVSLGTAVRHLDTLEQYAKAWQDVQRAGTPENIQTLNRIKAAISREFGSSAATNLQTAANIVGPEIVKAIGVAGAGTDAERSRATAQFTAAQSPEQLYGATNVTKGLLGGQLEGRRRQASEAGVDEARFKRLIGERPYEVLTNIDKGGKSQERPKAAAADRFQELIKAGKSKEDAYATMHKEGY